MKIIKHPGPSSNNTLSLNRANIVRTCYVIHLIFKIIKAETKRINSASDLHILNLNLV